MAHCATAIVLLPILPLAASETFAAHVWDSKMSPFLHSLSIWIILNILNQE